MVEWIQFLDGLSNSMLCCEIFGYSADRFIYDTVWLCRLFGTSFFLHRRWFSEHSTNHEQQGSRKRTVSHKSLVHAPGEKTSGCFHEQHSPHLFSSLSLLHLSIPRSCSFFITGLLSSRACSLLLALTLFSLSPAFFLPSSVYWLRFDSYLSQPCEPLDPGDPSPPPGGGHQSTGAICLHVMEVWGCGARLGPSRPSGEGQPRQMPKHSRVCVCVRTGPALSHYVSTGLTR